MRPTAGWLPFLVLAGCAPAEEGDPPDPLVQGPVEPEPWGSGTTVPTEPPVSDGLELGEPVVCDRPELRDQLGPTWEGDFGDDWRIQLSQALSHPDDRFSGAGVVVADLTGDGRLDVFLPEETACMLFVGQADGTLADESLDRIPLADQDCIGWNGAAGDYDGDGDLDLYVGRNAARDQLWQNDGTGHFTDVTDAAGLVDLGCATRSASWGDMDGDGDLDLMVARHRLPGGEDPASCPDVEAPPEWSINAGDPNTLYENDGDGTFSDVSDRLAFDANYGHSFIGGWVDLDVDGDLDLYVVNDFGTSGAASLALRNDGTGHFEPFPQASGLELRGTLMGIAVGDVNEDGQPDLALTQIDKIYAMISGGGLWFDASNALGIVPDYSIEQHVAWGTELADFDNDTDLDLAVVFGPVEQGTADITPEREIQPDALFIQDQAGQFHDEARDWGVDQVSAGRGLVVADVDGNGWLDTVRTNYRRGSAKIHLQRCGEASWLAVDLVGPNHGYGATVQVRVGDRWLTRWHNPSSTSLASSGPPGVHFGLGSYDVVDELVVWWPDGTESRYERVPAQRKVRVLHDFALER